MSTSINQIIEVRKDGKWQYVPSSKTVTDETSSMQHCGTVRDLFAYKWWDADDYLNCGVPEDISKAAREAMIYGDEDYVESGACWISATQFEALTEHIRQKFLDKMNQLADAKKDGEILTRLTAIERYLNHDDAPQETDNEEEIDWIAEEMEDLMWAWVNLERNWAEIEALVNYATDGEYHQNDIRVVMFVS
jgi:hypothetical protein